MAYASKKKHDPVDNCEAVKRKLRLHFDTIKSAHMRDLFEQNTQRFNQFSLQHEDILLDYSKNRINEETLGLLMEFARASEVETWRDRMFRGEEINLTEHQPVLHIALRNRSNKPILVDGRDVMPEVNNVIQRMSRFAEKVRSGEWTGYTGKRITDIVNIGIGGSDLGPQMVCRALRPYQHENLKAHFISSVDGTHIEEELEELNPETTLFIISSKSFTTQETIANAKAVRYWFLTSAVDESHITRHFVAVSTNRKAVAEFGIDPDNMFEFWDWVSGRCSLWSAIGLSIVLVMGPDNFIKLLEGAHAMDNHFATAPLEENMPVILAMIGIWYNNYFDAETYAVLPYDHYLRNLPIYLEQVDMESNGKSIDRDGNHVDYTTGPVVWGAAGINGQHTFFQLIHQGTKLVPADFIASVQTHSAMQEQHDIIISNLIAQTEALMRGRTLEETRAEIHASGKNIDDMQDCLPHMVFEGNHPSNTILLKKLTPFNLGALIALYEHKIFVQGIIWNLNSYDQWGVELGKQLARTIRKELVKETSEGNHDASTTNLIQYYKKFRNSIKREEYN